jgi:hypothetical protein
MVIDLKVHTYISIPVVPHKAVAEVSKIGNVVWCSAVVVVVSVVVVV